MKKIIAILLALAVVSMAFAQSVWVNNELSTQPEVSIGGGETVWHFRGKNDGGLLTDKVSFGATTEDGRASVGGSAWVSIDPSFSAKTEPKVWDDLDGTKTKLFNVVPHLQWNKGANAWGKFKLFNNNIEVGIGTDLGTWMGKGMNWLADAIAVGDGLYFTNGSRLVGAGAYVSYVGIEGLNISAAMQAADGDGWSGIHKGWFKKNLYPLAVAATYNNDLFGVNVLWKGVFGYSKADSELAKGNSINVFTAGFTFKGLQSLPVAITPAVGVQFEADKGKKNTQVIGVTADVDFNFNNGIQTKPFVTVVFGKDKDTNASYKVLPFSVGNTLTYSPNGDCTFTLQTQYAQQGSVKKTKEFGATDTFKSEVRLNPEFSFNMGKSTFNFGVNTNVLSSYTYKAKTDYDWAYSYVTAEQARVRFPIKWTYHF